MVPKPLQFVPFSQFFSIFLGGLRIIFYLCIHNFSLYFPPPRPNFGGKQSPDRGPDRLPCQGFVVPGALLWVQHLGAKIGIFGLNPKFKPKFLINFFVQKKEREPEREKDYKERERSAVMLTYQGGAQKLPKMAQKKHPSRLVDGGHVCHLAQDPLWVSDIPSCRSGVGFSVQR